MRTPGHILIVEDERDLADLLAFNLQRAGYETEWAQDGLEALRRIRSSTPSLVVLDVMLPKLSGLDVAQEIRRDPRSGGVPILMLTAKAAEADQLAGLGVGADDYLTKPFSMKVLLARVEALLRRTTTPPPEEASVISFGPIEADVGRHTLMVGGAPVVATLTEFRILAALVRAKGRALSRLDLMSKVMGPGVMVTARTIDVHVAAIRRKLGEAGRWIHTVRGVGYRLADPAGEGAAPPAPLPAAARPVALSGRAAVRESTGG
jgi:two-component system phosphate regulon response regulator PhoB